jgi:lipid-A-disaccharide synthase
MRPKLGIVAGQGELPARIIETCRATGRDFFVVAIEGQADPRILPGTPHMWCRLGAAETGFAKLREVGAKEVVLAGAVTRPSLDSLRPDLRTARFLGRLARSALGDDGLLSAVVREFEEYGFDVVGADDILGEMIAVEGPYGSRVPDSVARSDIEVGRRVARTLGALDVGQAVIVQQGVVLGVEAIEGTDALIARCCDLQRQGQGGVLVKVKKPAQERRVDLPTIGVGTVEAAGAARLSGIAVEAGGALVIDPLAVGRAADAAGLFVVGVRVADEETPEAGRKAPHVFLIAGEPSGDSLGAQLMSAIKGVAGDRVRFSGIGGVAMKAEGLESLFPMAELSVMGLIEVVPRVPRLLRRLQDTVSAIERVRPDAVVTIDAPSFCLRVARRLKRGPARLREIPIVHLVAPQVWAWRPGRAAGVARVVDHLLTLLPFEPAYFERFGLRCTFIGHPVVESGADKGDGPGFRARHGIPASATVVCLLPGSRHGEVRRLLPVYRETIGRLQARVPDLWVVAPTAGPVEGDVTKALAAWDVPTLTVAGRNRFDAFAASDVALAASGTVTLELALAGVPMVVAYRMNPVTAWLARRLVTVKYANLINLVLDRPAIPELLLEECRPAALAEALETLITDEGAKQAQRRAANEALETLGRGGPSPIGRAARAVLEAAGWRPVPVPAAGPERLRKQEGGMS